MIKNIPHYVEYFSTLDKPIEYKGLNIYLFKVKDYYELIGSYDILTQEEIKNKTPDIKIIQMSYLQYITTVLFNDKTKVERECYTKGDLWKHKFLVLMTKSFDCKPQEIQFLVNNKGKVFLRIKGIDISSKDFNEIKDIILYGNFKNYEKDDDVNDDVKKALRERDKILNKNKVYPSLEKQILFILRDTAFNKKELLELTYREFSILYGLCIDDREYILNNLRDMSGKTYEIKDKEVLQHYMYRDKYNPYKDLFRNANDVKDKLQM